MHFLSTVPDDYMFTPHVDSNLYATDLSQTRKLETQHHVNAEQLEALRRNVITLEIKLGVQSCWQPSSPEYQETLKYLTLRKYHRALDNLQCLVVQRLFELQKLNVAQTDKYFFVFLYSYFLTDP
jgi:hypothetical protein